MHKIHVSGEDQGQLHGVGLFFYLNMSESRELTEVTRVMLWVCSSPEPSHSSQRTFIYSLGKEVKRYFYPKDSFLILTILCYFKEGNIIFVKGSLQSAL